MSKKIHKVLILPTFIFALLLVFVKTVFFNQIITIVLMTYALNTRIWLPKFGIPNFRNEKLFLLLTYKTNGSLNLNSLSFIPSRVY